MPTAEKREPGLIICDERRRVTLPKGLAEEGEEFIAFKVRGDIILKPLIKDALNVFRREGKKLKGLSRKDIKKLIEKEAEKEALKGI